MLQDQITTIRSDLDIDMFRLNFLVLSILCAFLSQYGRAMRWSKFIKISGFRVNNVNLFDAYFKSILANNVLPLRMGDVLRATYYGRKFTGSSVTGIILIISEKVLDTVALLLVIGIAFYDDSLDYLNRKINIFGFTGLALLVFGWIFLLYIVWRSPKTKKHLVKSVEFSKKLQIKKSESLSLVVHTLVIWILEALSFYCALQSLGIEITYIKSIILMSIVTLSTSIPSTPGYFGTFHLVFIEALRVLDSSTNKSFVAAVSVHLILWLTSNLIGIWYVVTSAWGIRSRRAQI